jgi:hypothetical protein
VTTANPANAYITVLPTTVKDLVVFIHSTDKKWATVTVGEKEFEAGGGALIEVSPKADEFESEFIAVDEATLTKALTDAHGLTATIEVIGDITLTADLNIDEPDLTIKGDKIIVPQDKTLTLNTNMESDIELLGTTCCDGGTNGAKLVVNGGTISNVTMFENEKKDKAIEKNPMVTFASDANPATFATIAKNKKFDVQAGTVVVNDAVQHKGNFTLAAGATLTVNGADEGAIGDLNFMGATVENNGTIEVKKDAKFDMTDADGNAKPGDGERMTNNGKFIHNVDAGVGTAVQKMHQNGEYRCRVNKQVKLDDALLQWTACSVIEFVNATDEDYDLGTGASISEDNEKKYKHNGNFIDYEVNANAKAITKFINPDLGSGHGDSEVIKVGNFTIVQGTTRIDFNKGDGKRTLQVNGNMVVKDNTALVNSKQITIKENLTVEGAGKSLIYWGKNENGGLAVAKDITVSGATFIAGTGANVDALNITCANFYLADNATATFGNRTKGDAKNMVVSGIIDNPGGCTFDIEAANQDGKGSVLAWVSCKELHIGGTFTAAKPRVE